MAKQKILSNINQNWNNQIGNNMLGFSNNNSGILSPNLSLSPEQRSYFAGTNAPVYPEDNDLDANWANTSTIEAPQKEGNFIQNMLKNSMAGQLFGALRTKPSMQKAIDDINATGEFRGTEYQIDEGRNKIYSKVNPWGLNLRSAFGSKDPEEMDQKKIDWAQKRLQKGKNISQRLRDILAKRKIDEKGSFINRPINEGAQFKPDVPIGPINTGQAPQRDGADMSIRSFDPGLARAMGSYNQRAGSMTKGDTYGPWKADGGRVGYALAGPVGVEQETDFIEGPQGGEEFQETVVEGQEQPSREQLEALAMEIFQLPLEQLDEQQLLVVYQEAMQGQPMEEDFQEEDVQFAANGGLASLL